MRVILQEKIHRLGNLGDVVEVRNGYARNFLIPQSKAIMATKENIELFEQHRESLEHKAQENLGAASTRADQLAQMVLTIPALVGEEGKLYGSIGPREISEAAAKIDLRLKKSEIIMSQGVIRHIGEYEVDVQLHSDVRAKLKVNVISG